MYFRYNYVEEPSNISYPKRHFQALSRTEQRKKMKVTDPDACAVCLSWLNDSFNTLQVMLLFHLCLNFIAGFRCCFVSIPI